MAKPGWGSASETSRRGSDKNTLNALEQERFLSSLDLDTADIPTIPDLDDIQPDKLSDTVKPSTSNFTIKNSIRELDSELLKQTSVEGLDLMILARKCLAKEEDLKEDDVPWTWNSIFVNFSQPEKKDTEPEVQKSD
ncbi:intraflagellar transport protein 43 homolog [Culicoides brevitarsis]|uniref:intraflagellar transport protein 43 homolog n=1 Tax=Culicoides brevitarsis TaxID=469753 RepID=UPI00307BB413